MKAKYMNLAIPFFSPSLLLATEYLQNSILFRICVFFSFWKNRASGFLNNKKLLKNYKNYKKGNGKKAATLLFFLLICVVTCT